MDLLPSPEQEEIASSSASFLSGQLPIERTRELIETDNPVDVKAWSKAAELGWFALGLPEELGGVGFSLADEAVLFREIGRSLASGPFLSTVLAVRVAAAAGNAEVAGALLDGSARAALALLDNAVVSEASVSGSLRVLDGVEAEYVLAVNAEGAALVKTADLTLVAENCLDEGSRLAVCIEAKAVPVAYVTASDDAIERRGLVLSAAMLSGISEACRDISIDYAKNRVQFDKPIGVNQAVKHPIANLAVRAESVWAQVAVAAASSDEGRADADFQALSARLVSADCALDGAAITIQVLGGIGFTYEHDANLFAKRAKALSTTFGGRKANLGALLAQPSPY